MIFLQKTSDAKRIYAKLIHSKINTDGFKNEGITYPSGAVQAKFFEEFYKDIGLNPVEVDFVEMHGTGTKVGDPQECFAVDAVFCKDRKDSLPIGSIKSNMGHSEAACLLNSIIKAVICFESGKIPPNINFNQPNPEILALVSGRLRVVTDVEESKGSLIAVNSFGFGGTNTHALLQINPKTKKEETTDDLPRLILWSGRTQETIDVILDSIIESSLNAEYIALLQATQIETQPANSFRGYGIFDQNASIISRSMNNFLSSKLPIVFIYSGMGSQWSEMGRDLMKIALFEAAITKCHNVLAKKGMNLKNILTSSDPKVFENILNSFVGITAIQVGFTDILKALGIEPNLIVGHSIGELGCAYVDGCLSAEEMILIAYHRGCAILESKGEGSMAAVGLGFKDLKDILVDGVEIACHNSADSSTITGTSETIANFCVSLQAKGFFVKEVSSSNVALHSRHIADVGPQLLNTLKELIKAPKKRSPRWISSSVAIDNCNTLESQYASAEYFVNNLLSPVLFEEACEELPKAAIVIEVAPHSLLQAILRRSFSEGIYVPLVNRNSKDNAIFFLEALGKLFENGVDMDVSNLYPSVEFPVSRSTPMISPYIQRGWDHREDFFVPYYDDKEFNDMQVEVNLQNYDFKFILGHLIDDRILFPETGFLFLVWKLAARQHLKKLEDFDVVFEDVKFLKEIHIDDTVKFTVIVNRGTGYFEVIKGKNAVANGTVKCAEHLNLTKNKSQTKIKDELKSKDFYKELKLRGYHYKDLFKSIVSCKMDGSSAKIKWESNWIAFLNCLLQIQIASRDARLLSLPSRIRKIIIKPKAHLEALSSTSDDILTAFYCKNKKVISCGGIEIRGLETQVLYRQSSPLPVFESYQFVPHMPTPKLSKLDTVRFCIQLAIENLQIIKVIAVEINTYDGRVPIVNIFEKVVNDLLIVTSELYYLTNDAIELKGVEVSSENFSKFTNVTFIIRSNCMTDLQFMDLIASRYEKIFIISRESRDFNINAEYKQRKNFKVVAVIPTDEERIVLVYYCKVHSEDTQIIKITNNNVQDWLPKLQKSAKNTPTIVYAQHEEISGIIGLVNCIRKEPNSSMLKCFFIDDPNAPEFDPSNRFYKTQIEKNLCMNVLRDGKWGSFTHLSLKLNDELHCQSKCCFASRIRGDPIKWIQSHLTPDRKDLVRVSFASLNFKDLVGEIKEDRLGTHSMGLEFSGITSSGDRVMGIKRSGALATHVNPDDVLLWNCPSNWNLNEAASVIASYAIVYDAFFIKTKIGSEKSILIHNGSQSIGLAAITVALAYKMKVFTTVNSEEKKSYILTNFPELKAENLCYFHDTSFEDFIMEQTEGKGVDYVLNSLQEEERVLASIRCLAKGGTFFDVLGIEKSKVHELCRNISYYLIDVSEILDSTNEEKLHIKMLLQNDIQSGIIKPLKTNIFKPDEIEQALQFLAGEEHIGKVLIQMRQNEHDNSSFPMQVSPRVYCNPRFSYVIVGGLGGFGLELADWLVLRGCRRLILSSSRGVTNSYQTYRIKIWQWYGVEVTVSTDDITTFEGCEKLIVRSNKLGPVGGIFNLAVRLNDSLFENQTFNSFYDCLAPKAIATEYFDKISRQICPHLEHFVVFSSVSCGRGNIGQSNYGMANSVMERIVEKRRKENLVGKAIQFGAIGEVGLLEEKDIEKIIAGSVQQRISSCLESLDTLLTVECPIVSCMVVGEKKIASKEKVGIIELILGVMSIKDSKTISMESKLSELGMDSLMTVEISQILERQLCIKLSPQELRTLTLSQLKAMEKQNEIRI